MAEDRTPRKVSLTEPTADQEEERGQRKRGRNRRQQSRERVERWDDDAIAEMERQLSERGCHDGPVSKLF